MTPLDPSEKKMKEFPEPRITKINGKAIDEKMTANERADMVMTDFMDVNTLAYYTAMKNAIAAQIQQAISEAIEEDRKIWAAQRDMDVKMAREEGLRDGRFQALESEVVPNGVYQKGFTAGALEMREMANGVFKFAIETQTMLYKNVGNPATKRDLDIITVIEIRY